MDASEMKLVCGLPPLSEPSTWMCPEGHVFKYRRRPLVSSCIFIFCFFLMERAALYVLKSFLYFYVERTLGIDPRSPSVGYVLISVFFGAYDMSPILIAAVSDAYLGSFKSIVIFGFTFVFGLTLTALFGGSWFDSSLNSSWCALLTLIGLVAVSAGGLAPCLTAFGGSQFHPVSQTSSGSTFFSSIFAFTNAGAIIGISLAVYLYTTTAYRNVLLCMVGLGLLGWLSFLAGSGLYIKRCVHTHVAQRTLSLVWSCIRMRSFDRNRLSHGGEFPDAMVDDIRVLLRLVPVFLCLIPLYLGQVQILTTFRTLARSLSLATPVVLGKQLPGEILMLTEPVTAILLTVLLNQVIYPFLQSSSSHKKWMPTHLTRLTIGAVLIAAGFWLSFGFQRYLSAVGSDIDIRSTVSVFCLVPPLVLFAAGQVLVVSSGYELSYSHAPDALRSVSIAAFSTVYAIGSILSVGVFWACRGMIDLPDSSSVMSSASLVAGSSSSTGGRFDVYYAVCGSLCLASVAALLVLRQWYATTKNVKIQMDVEKRAMEIALKRVRAMSEQRLLLLNTSLDNTTHYSDELQPNNGCCSTYRD